MYSSHHPKTPGRVGVLYRSTHHAHISSLSSEFRQHCPCARSHSAVCPEIRAVHVHVYRDKASCGAPSCPPLRLTEAYSVLYLCLHLHAWHYSTIVYWVYFLVFFFSMFFCTLLDIALNFVCMDISSGACPTVTVAVRQRHVPNTQAVFNWFNLQPI